MTEPRKTPFVPAKPASEVETELSFHIGKRIAANLAAGMSPDEARRAAIERFGDMDGVRDECTQILSEDRRARARRDWLEDLSQDLRFAFRSAIREPMFTLLAIGTLALGIGANAAVFGVVKSVLLNSLPYGKADQLMQIFSPLRTSGELRGSLSAGTVSDIRERQHSFGATAAWLGSRDVVFTGGTTPPRVMQAIWTEPSFFSTLGVPLLRGPGFTDLDAAHDTSLVTILSYATWQELFGGAPDVVGKTIQLNGIGRTVVGILPRSFVPPDGQPDFYLVTGIEPFMRDPISRRGSHNFSMVARLKPGVSPETADRELNGVGSELERLFAKDNLGIGLTGTPLRDAMVGDTKTPLLVLLGSAALVLLITCANLAGALLSRTISRRKEFAVRVALGAGRGRLVRQLMTESVLLSFAGGIAGVFLAIAGLGLLRGLAIEAIPKYADLSLDSGAVIVTFVLTLITGLAFGLGPAMSVGKADPQTTLRDETRGSTESRRSRQLRGVLVAGQIALCVSLLAAAGLLARSLWEMTTAPIGFNPDKLLTFTIQLQNGRYSPTVARAAFHDQFEQRLRGVPGVSAVAITGELPTTIRNSNGIFIQDQPWGPNDPVPFITTARVSDDYFPALGIPLRQGRIFNTSDAIGAAPSIIINEAMAQKYWPRGNAVGAHVHIGPPNPTAPWITVVGIVGNVRNNPTALRPEPMMFIPLRQQPFGDTYLVRTAGVPLAMTTAIRKALSELDPQLPMYRVATMQSVIDNGFAARRLPVTLMIAFGALALVLASVGIYAMFASMATAREREFGVRIALGSTPGQVAGLVLRQGGVWMGLGLVVGGAGVAAAARLVRTQLYGVTAFDPLAIGLAVLVLLVCAGVALLVPVRKASRVDPITVLR